MHVIILSLFCTQIAFQTFNGWQIFEVFTKVDILFCMVMRSEYSRMSSLQYLCEILYLFVLHLIQYLSQICLLTKPLLVDKIILQWGINIFNVI